MCQGTGNEGRKRAGEYLENESGKRSEGVRGLESGQQDPGEGPTEDPRTIVPQRLSPQKVCSLGNPSSPTAINHSSRTPLERPDVHPRDVHIITQPCEVMDARTFRRRLEENPSRTGEESQLILYAPYNNAIPIGTSDASKHRGVFLDKVVVADIDIRLDRQQ